MPPKIPKKTVSILPDPNITKTQQIESIVDERIDQQGNTSYLVQWKNSKTINQCTWQPQFNLTTFKDKIKEYHQGKINEENAKTINTQKLEPKTRKSNQSLSKKKSELLLSSQQSIVQQGKRVRENSLQIQGSLDGFIKGVQKKVKKDEEEDDQPLKKTVGKSTAISSNKQILKPKASQPKKSAIQKLMMQQKSDPILDKVANIRSILKFQVKNGQVKYSCLGQDKNKQEIFLPPISSEIASKLNPIKVIDFLQGCLMRGYHAQKNNR